MSEQHTNNNDNQHYSKNRHSDRGNGYYKQHRGDHQYSRPRGNSNYRDGPPQPHNQQYTAPPPVNNNIIGKDPTARFKHFDKTIDEYDKIDKLGEGTYGEVFKARHNKTNEIVAIKKVRMDREKEGFPITTIREICILKTLKHRNIVQLKDVIASKDKGNFFMVFEYVEHDLAGLLDAQIPFPENEIKSIIQQLLEALFHIHAQNILHRDLKASNLLITRSGCLKLGDFGLSRFTTKGGKGVYTNRVVTRWYRPPELLLGSVDYGPQVDMWSVGCIMAELLLKSKALFPGKSELEQLDLIFNICGSPTVENWPNVVKLPLWNDYKHKETMPRALKEKLFANNTKWSPAAIDLLDKLLQLDPSKRPSAKDCLDHDWFWKNGPPIVPRNLPDKTTNEFTARQKKSSVPLSGSNHPPGNSSHQGPPNGGAYKDRRNHHGQPSGHNGSHHPPPHHDNEPPYKKYKGNYRGGGAPNNGQPHYNNHGGHRASHQNHHYNGHHHRRPDGNNNNNRTDVNDGKQEKREG